MSLLLLRKPLAKVARAIIRAYSGSLYIPNDANCFQDSAGTTAGAKDAVVGYLKDMVGTNHATQATTGYKPILRKGAKNLLLQSQDFGTTWINSNSTESLNATTAPDGTTTADKLASVAATGQTYFAQDVGVIAASYGFSVYAKAAEATYLQIWVGTASTGYVNFDLANGAVGGSNLWTGTIEAVGGGWYRCKVITNTLTAGNGQFRFGIVPASDSGRAAQYTGDGTSGIYLWGAQLEVGSTVSTYVATTSAPASNGIGPWWLDFDGTDDVLAAGAFGAGFASSTLVRANYGAVQTTTTAQDLSAGYNMTTANSGLIVVPDTVSAADLALLQRYANSLGGYSA